MAAKRGKPVPTKIGLRVRSMREAKNWSKGELSVRSGIGQPAITLIEQGNRPNPKLDTLEKLARAFGVSLDELTGFDSGPSTGPAEATTLTAVRELTDAVRALLQRPGGT